MQSHIIQVLTTQFNLKDREEGRSRTKEVDYQHEGKLKKHVNVKLLKLHNLQIGK